MGRPEQRAYIVLPDLHLVHSSNNVNLVHNSNNSTKMLLPGLENRSAVLLVAKPDLLALAVARPRGHHSDVCATTARQDAPWVSP